MGSWDELPVVVTVAPVGAEVTRDDNPALPHTPAEIAAEVAACAEAGASVCHLHVREEDGSPSSRPELFAEAIGLIRERSPIVTMVSTGGAVWMPMADRMTGLEAGPDLAGVETGSMNFGEDPFVTVPADARKVVERAGELGIGLEAEMFDVGHVVAAVRMLERGELPPPLRANLVFGVPGGVDATPEALDAMLRPLPPGTHWSITAVGRHQRRMLALAVLRGAGGIRVGFEDGVYLRRGVLAASNAELVADACELVRTLGREPAAIEQARELLSCPVRQRA
jgi:3-keto-5-aminohexanoate cleavage enzyme